MCLKCTHERKTKNEFANHFEIGYLKSSVIPSIVFPLNLVLTLTKSPFLTVCKKSEIFQYEKIKLLLHLFTPFLHLILFTKLFGITFFRLSKQVSYIHLVIVKLIPWSFLMWPLSIYRSFSIWVTYMEFWSEPFNQQSRMRTN